MVRVPRRDITRELVRSIYINLIIRPIGEFEWLTLGKQFGSDVAI
jgi:hypothetical protein